jgi:hypothetical protein
MAVLLAGHQYNGYSKNPCVLEHSVASKFRKEQKLGTVACTLAGVFRVGVGRDAGTPLRSFQINNPIPRS